MEAMGHSNIFLVGMMGAGKTTVGRALATRMKRELVDYRSPRWWTAPAWPWPSCSRSKKKASAGGVRDPARGLRATSASSRRRRHRPRRGEPARCASRASGVSARLVYLGAHAARFEPSPARHAQPARAARATKQRELLPRRHIVAERSPEAATLVNRVLAALRARSPGAAGAYEPSTSGRAGWQRAPIHRRISSAGGPAAPCNRRAAIVTKCHGRTPPHAGNLEAALDVPPAPHARIELPDGEASAIWRTLNQVF
jgi:hypothetical protein